MQVQAHAGEKERRKKDRVLRRANHSPKARLASRKSTDRQSHDERHGKRRERETSADADREQNDAQERCPNVFDGHAASNQEGRPDADGKSETQSAERRE